VKAKRPKHLIDAKALDTIKDSHQRTMVRVTCDLCGATDTHKLSTLTMPPAAIAKWFRNRGWNIKGNCKKATCPACQEAKPRGGLSLVPDASPPPAFEAPSPPEAPTTREPEPVPEPEVLPPRDPEPPKAPVTDATAPEPPADPPAPLTARAFQQQRKLYLLLETHYDVDAHCYTGGYTDQRCAEETGLSVSYVRQLRENAYGPVIDPEIQRLQATVSKMRKRHREELSALQGMVEEAIERHSRELDKLEAQIKKQIRSRKV